MKKISLIALALGAAALFACDPVDNSTTTSDYVAPELALSDTTVTIASSVGAKATVTVTTDQKAISVAVDYSCKSWLTAKVEGDVVTITATAKNPDKEPRSGVVLVTVGEKGVTAEKYIEVIQNKNDLSLSATEITLGMGADSAKDVDIDSQLSGLKAAVSSDASAWLKAVIDGKTLKVTVLSENTDENPRSGVITVSASGAEATLNVTQSGNVATLELDPADDISYIRWAGSKTEVTVTTNKTPTISLSEGASSWLKVDYNEGKMVISTTDTNNDPTDRSAVVTVSAGALQKSINIKQAGLPNPKIGTAYGTEGIIFWQDPENPKQYKIVAAQSEKHVWAAANTETGVNDSKLSAKEANDIIKGLSDYTSNNYAVKYCADMGEGWYLPVESEVIELFKVYTGEDGFDESHAPLALFKNSNHEDIPAQNLTARNAFDATMTSIGGVLLDPKKGSGDSCWVCREKTGGAEAYYIRWGKLIYQSGTKTSTARYARCMKVVTIE